MLSRILMATVLAALAAALAVAQPVPAKAAGQAPSFSSAPTGGDLIEATEILSTTSTQLCARTTVALTRAAADQLAIGAACSATDRCWLRFAQESQAVAAATTTATLSGGGASDDGKLIVYAKRTSSSAYTIYVGHDLPAATVTCAGSPGCTVVTGITSFPPGTLPIGMWSVLNGALVISGGTVYSSAATCWVDMMTLTNVTAGSVTVTAADVRGTPIPWLTTVPVAANTTYVVVLPGGLKFEGGLTMLASADDSINLKYRAIK